MFPDCQFMPSHRNFLVIDADTDGRMLLVRTLMRVFPQSAIIEVQDFHTALALAKANRYDAIVAHRAIGADAKTLVQELHRLGPDVPILAVSGIDRTKEVLAAGATRFLNFEEWLMLGSVITEMLSQEGLARTGPFTVDPIA